MRWLTSVSLDWFGDYKCRWQSLAWCAGISSISVGQTFGVQVTLEDLRAVSGIGVTEPSPTNVFAAYMDLLYDSDIIVPAAPNPGSEFDFGVVFRRRL